jgi:hypothetical protein
MAVSHMVGLTMTNGTICMAGKEGNPGKSHHPCCQLLAGYIVHAELAGIRCSIVQAELAGVLCSMCMLITEECIAA